MKIGKRFVVSSIGLIVHHLMIPRDTEPEDYSTETKEVVEETHLESNVKDAEGNIPMN